MRPDTTKLLPARQHTDHSLRVERANSDKALIERRAIVDQRVDDQVEEARDRADATLGQTRERADAVIEAAEPASVETAVARERRQADRILQTERAAADERLEKGRRNQAAALAALLPLERRKTDRFLLTERLRSDDALAQRDDFLGMVSHDLRNLLHGIVLNSNLLSAKASASDEGRRTVAGVQQIQRYAACMNRLIGDLLDVASIDAGRLAIQPEAGDAATLITEAVAAFAGAAADKQITLDADVIRPPLVAEFDRERILQVLSKLLSNAVKFTPAGGTITMRGACSERALEISVNDTGDGIPVDQWEAVFERFWQVGKSDRRGLGLGLFISRCIVEAHGGRIWIASKPGEGSTFFLKIPRHQPTRTT
ncbi:sensor histidine kinase [Sinimarinibacterium flocculans]|uniref:sensor histidine kinase n=1 Tax=Sinimarinibacterium flocculans TaxID=985250 RepID=UPI0024928330|nr:ATP-binding protein [Sinimarinibacterium flocculans]